jgi:hypothetical protein
MARTCRACGHAELSPDQDPARKTELRPYGPDGAPICFPCAMRPENLDEAVRQFTDKIAAAWKAGDGVAVLSKDGPQPARTSAKPRGDQ